LRIRSGLFALVFAVACSESLAPLTGDIYVLGSIAGVSLPAPYTASPSVNGRIIADTMAFASDGRGTRRTRYEGANGPSDVHSEEATFTYTKTGDHVEVWFACPPNADCIAGPHLTGTLINATWTVETAVAFRVPMIFFRLFPPD
jgi:hypothetical protein